MIYFYYGTDIKKTHLKSYELINSLLKKKPDASFFKIDTENFDVITLKEYVGSQGLFSDKYIVLLDRLCEKKDIKEEYIDLLKEISGSDNIFIILEGKIDKVTATKIEKKSEKTIKFDLEESFNKKSDSNAFEIANALGRRNKKEIWILYRKYIDSGSAPEELHGILFWKAKNMLLIKDFSSWKEEELLNLIDKLITIYHEARRGNGELETSLEALILII